MTDKGMPDFMELVEQMRRAHDPVRLQCGPYVRFIVTQCLDPGGFNPCRGFPTRKKPCELFHATPRIEMEGEEEE